MDGWLSITLKHFSQLPKFYSRHRITNYLAPLAIDTEFPTKSILFSQGLQLCFIERN